MKHKRVLYVMISWRRIAVFVLQVHVARGADNLGRVVRRFRAGESKARRNEQQINILNRKIDFYRQQV